MLARHVSTPCQARRHEQNLPSRAMTTILDTLSHSSLNSSMQPSTSSDRKHTTASCASYTMRLDGRRTPRDVDAVAMRLPTSCCTCRSLTQVTILGPFEFAPGAHHASGTTRMFGIAASRAAESCRTSEDWMSRAGMACESVLCSEPKVAGSPGGVALTGTAAVAGNGGYTWEYGILSLLSCFSTFVCATRALQASDQPQTTLKEGRTIPAISVEFVQDLGL